MLHNQTALLPGPPDGPEFSASLHLMHLLTACEELQAAQKVCPIRTRFYGDCSLWPG